MRVTQVHGPVFREGSENSALGSTAQTHLPTDPPFQYPRLRDTGSLAGFGQKKKKTDIRLTLAKTATASETSGKPRHTARAMRLGILAFWHSLLPLGHFPSHCYSGKARLSANATCLSRLGAQQSLGSILVRPHSSLRDDLGVGAPQLTQGRQQGTAPTHPTASP